MRSKHMKRLFLFIFIRTKHNQIKALFLTFY